MSYFYLTATDRSGALCQISKEIGAEDEAFKLAEQISYTLVCLGIKEVVRVGVFKADFFDESEFKQARDLALKTPIVRDYPKQGGER